MNADTAIRGTYHLDRHDLKIYEGRYPVGNETIYLADGKTPRWVNLYRRSDNDGNLGMGRFVIGAHRSALTDNDLNIIRAFCAGESLQEF